MLQCGTGLFGTFFFVGDSLRVQGLERERNRNRAFGIMQGQVGGSNCTLPNVSEMPNTVPPKCHCV